MLVWVLVHEAKTVPHPRLILTYSLVIVINKLLLGKKKPDLACRFSPMENLTEWIL